MGSARSPACRAPTRGTPRTRLNKGREAIGRDKAHSHSVRLDIRLRTLGRRATTGTASPHWPGTAPSGWQAGSVRRLDRWRPGSRYPARSRQGRKHSSVARSGEDHEVEAIERRSGGELPADGHTAYRAVSLENRANTDPHLFLIRREYPQLPPDLHECEQASR